MSVAIESGIGTLNYGRQSAKGTIATAATVTTGYDRPRWVSGGLKSAKALGQEAYLDGNRFDSPSVFTDKVGGNVGSVVLQLQPENAGLYFGQVLASDTVTGSSDPYTHTMTSAGTSTSWGTWWQKVGSAVGPQREVYYDSKISKIMLECGEQQKVMHGTLDIMALAAAQVFTADPSKTEATTDPFLWTEVTGAITFDSAIFSEVSGETLEIDTQMEAYWGDDINPNQLVEKSGTIVRTLKTIVTDSTLSEYRKIIWGTASPTAGTNPVKAVFSTSVSTVYTKTATRKLTVTTPNMAVDPSNIEIHGQPDGGSIPIEFGGPALKSGATAALTVVALTGDATTYA